tara:strand:- start:68 stop:448 length:381 start_codon:yes stop_codon:yes gene_type:complete
MGRTNLWYKVDVRLSDKFEVLHIAKRLGISSNECVGSLLKLWSISLTDFPEGKGKLSNGSLSVTIDHLPTIMQLDNEPQEIFDALKECSWIDLDDGVIVIPSWDSKTGQTLLKMERDRTYKRKEVG